MRVRNVKLQNVKELLVKGFVVRIPLERPDLLEQVKNEVYPSIGPIGVSINVRDECYRVQRDIRLPKKLWY